MEFLSTVVPTLELHLPTLVTFQVHIASGARFIFKYVRHPHLKYTLQHDMYTVQLSPGSQCFLGFRVPSEPEAIFFLETGPSKRVHVFAKVALFL